MKLCLVACYSHGAHLGDNVLTRVSDLLSIFGGLAEEIFLITGEVPQGLVPNRKLHIISVKFFGRDRPFLIRALKELAEQLTISWHLLKILRHVDCILGGVNTGLLLLPLILAKLNRRKSILFLPIIGDKFLKTAGLARDRGTRPLNDSVLPRIVKILASACCSLADIVIANSAQLLEEPWLQRHKNKAFPFACPARFIDTSLFKMNTPVKHRARQIGYAGRLSEEKGVVNLIEAIPFILERQGDLEFVVIGEGPQTEQIRGIITENNLSSKVRLTGWVDHKELPVYLDQMQLLVLPSFTEGLPTVALEAMACGTPVLATPVGGVPELITDGETGFILEDNSPECIAEGILRALDHPNLDEITRNAQMLIEENHAYGATVERFRKLFASLTKEGEMP